MQSINVNHIEYKAELIDQKLRENIEDWERSIFQFLHDWLDHSEHITIQTSGSTGTPKKIKKHKQQFIESALATGKFFDFKEGQTILLCLPADFVAGRMMLVRAMVWKLKVIAIPPKIKLEIPNTPIDFSAMTPPQIAANLSNLSTLETIIIGGAPISENLESQLKNLSNKFYATYGMTETLSHVALRKIGQGKFFGLPGIEFGLDQRDCLLISAPKLNDGKLVTNDIVHLHTSASFSWVGRFDNVINSGGLKISAEEIEAEIQGLLHHNYFITSQKDSKWGESVVLVIESPEGDKKALQESLSNVLVTKKRPRNIYFLEKFIFTDNGKLNRQATKALLGI